MLSSEGTSHFRVYVEDTDLMGVVYHGKYAYFFERGRTEFLRDHGISLTTMARYGTYFAIRSLQMDYHYAARLDDMLSIITKVEKLKGCSLFMHQKMLNQDNRLVAQASVQVVTVDSAFKPKRVPQALLTR